jgi:hypothetical protein
MPTGENAIKPRPHKEAVVEITVTDPPRFYKYNTSHELAKQEAEWIGAYGFSDGGEEISADDIVGIRIGGK